MHHVVPPLCLLMALAMLVTAFALLAGGPPDASTKLDGARASGDEAYTAVLEAQLHRRQLLYSISIGLLFFGAVMMALTAFLSMRPPLRRTN